MLKKTADPDILIEAGDPSTGYVRYRHSDGRHWEVYGVCDKRGNCLIGAVIDGIQVRDHEHLKELKEKLGKERIDSEIDVPVGPGFKGCCPLKIVEL